MEKLVTFSVVPSRLHDDTKYILYTIKQASFAPLKPYTPERNSYRAWKTSQKWRRRGYSQTYGKPHRKIFVVFMENSISTGMSPTCWAFDGRDSWICEGKATGFQHAWQVQNASLFKLGRYEVRQPAKDVNLFCIPK